MAKKPGKLHRNILEVFKRHEVNHRLTVPQLRAALGLGADAQRQFERRLRELRAFGFDLIWENEDYWLTTFTPTPVADVEDITGRLRAEVLNAAHGRCGMCGKTITEDGVKLRADHRIPRSWGGKTERDNLWAICELCNIQKRDYFASFDQNLMSRFMNHDEPIVRIGELLKAFEGKIVPRRLLEVAGDGQDEWPRRLRELREIGWKIPQVHDPSEKGKNAKAYRLESSLPWPNDIQKAIREHRRKVYKKLRTKRSEPDESL